MYTIYVRYIQYTLHDMKFIVQAPNFKGGALGISIPLRDSSANDGTAGLQNTWEIYLGKWPYIEP